MYKKYYFLFFLELIIIFLLGFLLVSRFSGSSTIFEKQTYTKPLPAREKSILTTPATHTLLFVGDMMFDRSIRAIIERHQDPLYPFARIADMLRSADLTIGNLEGPISDRGTNQGSEYSFRFEPTGTMSGLKFAGFDVVTLANNHIWDYGRLAGIDTMKHLTEGGISYVGFGHDSYEAGTPIIKTLGSTTIGFLGFTEFYGDSARAGEASPGLSTKDEQEMLFALRDLRTNVDLVVVLMHWGEEYKTRANIFQRELARSFIDAGADLVVGHHPHVVQEVESYLPALPLPKGACLPAGRYRSCGEGFFNKRIGHIAYSLGNFIFDQNFSPDTRRGLVLKVTLYQGKVFSVESLPIAFTKEYQPYILY